MARVDIPTLQCDRCKATTQDINEMDKYWRLRGQWDGYGKTKEEWDLCPKCKEEFKKWMENETLVT